MNRSRSTAQASLPGRVPGDRGRPYGRSVERRQVHLLDRRQNEPGKMVLRQPFPQIQRHQQHLIAVACNEVFGIHRHGLKPAGELQQSGCSPGGLPLPPWQSGRLSPEHGPVLIVRCASERGLCAERPPCRGSRTQSSGRMALTPGRATPFGSLPEALWRRGRKGSVTDRHARGTPRIEAGAHRGPPSPATTQRTQRTTGGAPRRRR